MYEILECGIHERRQYAQRQDGQWFARYQRKTMYGYQWTKWNPVTAAPEKARPNRNNPCRARLPR